ncbi:MAG TPA: TolC family protein [Firmicutes bacterium]|nr:TolC family protein [Bacillota bacterium]
MKVRATTVAAALAGLLMASVSWAPPAHAESWAGGDLTLERCIALGLERNLGYASARLNVEVSASATRQAGDKLLPKVTVGGNYDRLAADAGEGPEVTVNVGQTYPGLLPALSLPGVSLPLGPVALAQSGEAQARARADKARSDLVFNISQAYYNVLKAARLREVQEAALAAAESARSVTAAKVNAGTATRVDLLRAEVDVANAELAVAKAKDNYTTAETALFALLRFEPPAAPVNYAPVPPAEAPGETLAALTDQAVAKRPEVTDAALELQRAISQEKQANLAALPAVNLTGGYTDDHWSVSSGWNPLSGDVSWSATASNQKLAGAASTGGSVARSPLSREGWNVGVEVSYPLYDAGALREAALQAKLKTAQAQNNLEQTKNSVVSEVQAAWFEWQEAKLSLEAARRAASLSAESQRLTQLRVENGVGTPYELSQANADYLKAQLDLVQAEFAEQLAIVKVKKAAGLLLG